MAFLLVPHTVTDATATIWVGAIDEEIGAKSVKLDYSGDAGGGSIDLDPFGWEEWRSYNPEDRGSYLPWDWVLPKVLGSSPRVTALYYQRVLIEGLQPRTTYTLNLHVDEHSVVGLEKHLREGRVTTLPEALPARGEKPFTLLLGSCFYGPEDSYGILGTTYHYISKDLEDERPEIKILCGDQVYLDNPWQETTFNWYRAFAAPGLFRKMLFDKYVYNWTQVRGEDAGFRRFLMEGANFFCSDDHEYWNNAPDFGGVGMVNTLTRKQRSWWFKEATALFRAFQSPRDVVEFEVPPLSVCIVDTRINREADGRRFMKDWSLRAVGKWIENLKGPGVLVVGQPLLARETGLRPLREGLLGRIKGISNLARSFSFDRSLPDYPEQYEELVGYIKCSRHSIVVLTGDVHFARVAHGRLRPGSEEKLVEVISSPLRVVPGGDNEPLFGHYRDAPTDIFPDLKSLKVTDKENHFATLQFSLGENDEVNMKVKYWPITRLEAETTPESEIVFQTTLP